MVNVKLSTVDVLVPAGYDIVWTVIMLVVLVAIVGAVVAIARSSRRRREEVDALRDEVEALKARDAARD